MSFLRVPSYLPACITANLVSPPDHSTSRQRGLPCSGWVELGFIHHLLCAVSFPGGIGEARGCLLPSGLVFWGV
jgi:hypothetical protein